MTAKLGKQAIAIILAEAEFATDQSVADRHGISRKSISRYRSQLAEDLELSQLVTLIKKEITDQFIESTAKTLTRVLSQIDHTVSNRVGLGNEKPSEWLHALAGTVKILGELMLENKVLSQK